jgi:hypothetical protein
VGGAQTPSHERLVMITKRKQIKILNEIVVSLMIENDELLKENKRMGNL